MTRFLVGLMLALAHVPAAAAGSVMPAAEQNALVTKYCTVCHTDAHPNGGLSLQHFDAEHPDAGVAAMIASKLKNGAMGAAGITPPDKATQEALLGAMSASADGADRWAVTRTKSPSVVTASVVQQVASANPEQPDLYRLIVSCRADSREGTITLAWSPNTPKPGRDMFAAPDQQAARVYRLDGTEKMGNGSGGTSGPGSIVLAAMPLPARTLTVSNVFQAQTVVFPFSALTASARRSPSACFAPAQFPERRSAGLSAPRTRP